MRLTKEKRREVTMDYLEKLGFDAIVKMTKEKKEYDRRKLLLKKYKKLDCEHSGGDFDIKINGTTYEFRGYCLCSYKSIPPLPVLRRIEKIQKDKLFDCLYIAEKGEDPLLIGEFRDIYTYETEYYLLAQWGDEKERVKL